MHRVGAGGTAYTGSGRPKSSAERHAAPTGHRRGNPGLTIAHCTVPATSVSAA